MAGPWLEGLVPLQIFTVTAGLGETEYSVHQSCLEKSPVLAQMCQGGSKEACEGRITFLADKPSHVAAIVEYLYYDDLGPCRDLKLQ